MPRWFRLLVLLALLGAPGVARAQQAPAGAAQQAPAGGTSAAAALGSERQRVRSDLDRVNAEIDSLKRDKRGWREDRELRSRMADADSLARRLTELDLRIERLNPGAARRNDTSAVAAPEARPSDDRAALEAKADILADQARHLESQAAVLAGRVTDLKGRQELRRRAVQLERDPFSPLEQSKRRIATGAPATTLGAKDTGANSGFTGTTSTPQRGAEGTSAPPPSAGGTGTASGSPAAPGTGPATGLTGDAAKTSTAGSLAPVAVPLGTIGGADAPGSVAGQFRGILDAATLAEIRRLESGGSPRSNVQAMERALAALRARAGQLNASAADLRMRAKTAP